MLISISYYQFSITAPFSEGDTLSASEAQALNALRAENIRNIAATWMKRALLRDRGPHEILDVDEIKRAAAKVAEIDARYDFPIRPEPKAKLGLLESEAWAVAAEKLDEMDRAQGINRSHLSHDEAVTALVHTPEVQDEARRRIATRVQVANSSLEDLLAGDDSQ